MLLLLYPAAPQHWAKNQKKGTPAPVNIVISAFLVSGRYIQSDSLRIAGFIPELASDENDITLYVGLLDYRSPWNTWYECRLDNYDNDWKQAGARSHVSYSHLPPGMYTFRVRAVNGREGTRAETALTFRVLPPAYRTWWAYLLYFAVSLALGFLFWRTHSRRLRMHHEIELGKVRTAQLEELDAMKSTFFSNISHEFRTPLALIQAPVDQLLEQTSDDHTRKKLHLVRRNASRLLHLVNQLLDLSKIDAHKFRLCAAPGDLVSFARGVVMVFESMAERKKLGLTYAADPERIDTYFDREIVEKVLGNLLSNAIRYTEPGGCISVNLRCISDGHEGPRSAVAIAVTDTGRGIAEEQRVHVFDRFYQVPDARALTRTGTGIGLALVKELITLHHGEVSLTSKLGEGSTFVVLLPVDPQCYAPEEICTVRSDEVPPSVPSVLDEQAAEPALRPSCADHAKPLLLVVEDNADLRGVMVEYLHFHYNIIEAVDGVDGWEQALHRIPDLVISDVMMPGMDGNALCLKLKQHPVTDHIPVILLTARGSGGSRLEGLEARADAYLVKPVDIRELQLRIRNLIELRKTMREKVDSLDGFLRLSKKDVTSAEEVFLQTVVAVIEQNIDDDTFCVEHLSAALAMSRTQLHRKLAAVANRSASSFIRSVRLQRAKEMLEARAGNVAEIAYAVGFKSQAHFSRCFKEEFGCTPSEVLDSSRS